MLKLYVYPGACSLAAHIVLEESGAVFVAESVDFVKNEQRSEEFLSVNPKGRVPVLVTDEGILTENPAILMFVAMKYPSACLAPLHDPFKLAQMHSFNAYLSSTVHVAHAHGPRGSRWAVEQNSHADMKRKVPGNMSDCFSLIESDYLTGPWVMGSEYTLSDAYLFTIANWLEADGVDPQAFPKVLEHRQRMMARPAVQTTLQREKQMLQKC